jgi:muconate cycloisomerase
LTVQIGCQVGESSLLSAAQLALVEAVRDVTYLEGCFGRRLLRDDPAAPVLQFGFGGARPMRPQGLGFGVEVDDQLLRRYAAAPPSVVGEPPSNRAR